MTHTLRLILLTIMMMAWAGEGRAQSVSEIRQGIRSALVEIALIERERARPDVPDDFAAHMLNINRQRLRDLSAAADRTGEGRAAKREATRRANEIISARQRTDYLRFYPDPMRVRADLDAERGLTGVELEGRKAGRLLMLDSSLAGLQGNNSNNQDLWPADVVQRASLYRLHFYDIRDRVEPTLEPIAEGCSRIPFMTCNRRTFHETRGRYRHDLSRAQETASLYFPTRFHARFVDATGIGGSREGYAQYQEEQRAQREQFEDARWRSSPERSIFIGLIGGAIIIGGIGLLLWLGSRGEDEPNERPTTGNYGTAQWAPVGKDPSPLAAFTGLFLGKHGFVDHPDEGETVKLPPVFTSPEAHTLIMAPTRTGKGTRIIQPSLLAYQGSMIVIDPKGENAAVTATQRALICEDRVHILNPWRVLHAELFQRGFTDARFNPLDVIAVGDPDAVGIAHTMAESICARSGDARNAYWEGSATAILTGVFLWLAYKAGGQGGEKKTLARARQIITLPQEQLVKEFFIPMAGCDAFGGAIAENIGPFIAGESKDMPAILRTLAEATRFISDERLKEATATSDFDIRRMPFERMTIYLVIPPDRMKVQGTWLRLMLAAVAHAFRTASPRPQTRGMMLIDELPALGRIPELTTDLATMSGYGLDYTLIVQDMGQLEGIYGEAGAQTILANCTWKWFCRVRDHKTAKYLSETLGQRTIATTTTSQGSSASGETSGTTFGEMGRSLLTPDEVMNLHRSKAIVLPPEGRAILVRPVDHWEFPREFQLFAEGSMRAFFMPPPLTDPNPYYQAKPDEASPA